MKETLRRISGWREKSTEYSAMALDSTDLELQGQYEELAARYLENAEKLETQSTAARVLDVPGLAAAILDRPILNMSPEGR